MWTVWRSVIIGREFLQRSKRGETKPGSGVAVSLPPKPVYRLRGRGGSQEEKARGAREA
jgi:hypothetical protein